MKLEEEKRTKIKEGKNARNKIKQKIIIMKLSGI